MEIKRVGSQPSAPGPADWFTGTVRIDHLFQPNDSRRAAEKARLAGVDVTLRVWHGLPHVWQYFAGILPEGKRALDEAVAFIRVRLPAAIER